MAIVTNPISKDIIISSGECNITKYQRNGDCGSKDIFGDNYIQYRSIDENKINYHYPEINIYEANEISKFEENFGVVKKYYYYQILPYKLFKDFQKVILRYDHLTENFDWTFSGITSVTTEFDVSSVLLVDNFQKRCRQRKVLSF